MFIRVKSKSNKYLHTYNQFIPTWCYLKIPKIYVTLNNSWGNTVIPSQRLATMSVSLRTQTVLCCRIIQVLNIKSLLPKCLIQSPFTSIHSNLEHGLAILTERFSPLRSVLHNLSCWSPKQKWCDKPCYSYFVTHTTTRMIWFELVPTSLNCMVKHGKCLVENSIVVLTLS